LRLLFFSFFCFLLAEEAESEAAVFLARFAAVFRLSETSSSYSSLDGWCLSCSSFSEAEDSDGDRTFRAFFWMARRSPVMSDQSVNTADVAGRR